jgi:SOS response regulatory protein OraA/RecX
LRTGKGVREINKEEVQRERDVEDIETALRLAARIEWQAKGEEAQRRQEELQKSFKAAIEALARVWRGPVEEIDASF